MERSSDSSDRSPSERRQRHGPGGGGHGNEILRRSNL